MCRRNEISVGSLQDAHFTSQVFQREVGKLSWKGRFGRSSRLSNHALIGRKSP